MHDGAGRRPGRAAAAEPPFLVTRVVLAGDLLRPIVVGPGAGMHPRFIFVGALGGLVVFKVTAA